ncbi:hypothetical protein R1flu_025608 [Riccia fluitans]|uniref:DDE Tnp4 domain-containing protein n=1 Tax=Riccia fluitans TaxID=41844 RepID=A0ABD1Y1B7_9MARC
MDATHAAGENPPNGKFLPVSPSDTMFFQAPASLTSANPNFALPPSGRIPFMMQGVLQLNGGFLETGTAGVSRPAAVRPFMNLNFGESVQNSASDAAADLTVEADIVQDGTRRRRQTASGKNASKPPAKEGVKSHFLWHDPVIVALIEAEKEEQDEDDGRSGHDEVLIVLLMMASFTLVLNLLLEDIFEDISEDEDLKLSKRLKLDTGFSHYEEGSSNLWPVAMQFCSCIVSFFCIQTGSWWVKERSLIWHDYFLMRAFEDFRWRSCVAVPRDLFLWMVSILSPRLERQNTHWRKPIPVDVKLAACLHRLVSGSSYLLCSDHFGIGASTLQEAMPDVVEAILDDLGPLFLTWPDAVEVQRVSETFQRLCSLPNVAGAIDGSHIKIRNPERRHARDYFNRKRDISFVLQGICDHDSAFLDISCGASGSVHDSRCLHLSSIFRRVEAGEVMVDPILPINDGLQLHPHLLGDQGYAMHPWLMVPFSLTGMSPPAQHLYNRRHVQGRLSIERAFELLKARFRILENGITFSVGWAGKLVHATCILHNVINKKRLGHDDVAAALEPVLRRKRATRSLRRRRQGRPDRPDSGHEVRDALVAYVMSRDT